MSIASYTELQSAITRWIARDDMAANIPDWIALFEAVANRRLRVRQQEATYFASTSGGYLLLPTDYLAFRSVAVEAPGGNIEVLEYMAPDVIQSIFPDLPQGIARNFAIFGSYLGTFPYNDTAIIHLDYFKKIPSLSAGINWLLAEYPDVYLFGALYHAYDFMLDLQNAAFRKSQRDEILEEIQILSNKSRGVGGMRVLGPTP